LPHLKPGKSLRFALLPEGQDPDDLARSGGRGAIEEVINLAKPLADVVWSREIEGGSYGTPERRAALEARINELTNGVRDEVVRRYYRQDFQQRLQRAFAPEAGGGQRGGFRGSYQPRGESAPRFAPRGSFSTGGGGRTGGLSTGGRAVGRGPYQVASPQLATSSIMRGQRTAVSRREALILQSLLNHPWLLHDHLEEVAALELAHPEAHKLRAGIIAAFSNYSHTDDPAAERDRLHASLEKNGYSEQIQKVERAITTKNVWAVQAGAAVEDVLPTWHQLVALHRQWHSLLRELKDAELALGQVSSEANYGWLRDVKARLAEVDGLEALIEGFGESSGRFQRSV
jgi:DNA primase